MSSRRFGVAISCLVLAASSAGGAVARAQSGNAAAAAPFGAPISGERIYAHFLLNEAEWRLGTGASAPFRWDAEAWTGTDRNRLWLKSEGIAADGRIGDGDQELLYDRPVTSFFDLQAGVRYDLDSGPGRAWAAVGVEGLAPYLLETAATLYVSDAGRLAGKLLASYEELLTQRLILEPRLEVNLYSRPEAARDVAAGASDLELGFRLRYEIRRKLAPYVGAVYRRSVGLSRPTAPLDTGRSGGWRLAAGLRAWF